MRLKQSEKQFQSAVLQLAKLRGWLCYHPYDSRRSTPGFPDLVLVRDGEVVFAELKTDKGKLTKAQEQWLEQLCRVSERAESALTDAGQCGPSIVSAVVWRPTDWPVIEVTLK